MGSQNRKIKVFDGRYEILSIIGRGQCSVVYKVQHIAPPHEVSALKVLVNRSGPNQGGQIEKLRKEALAMVSSRHKYVARLDDFRSVNELCYLSMEYAPEKDLRSYAAKKGGKLPVDQVLVFFQQMLEALSFIHDSGITHRDIKPDNILVINDSLVHISDFGIAVLPGEQASFEELQRGVGTMDYMAPEVFRAKSSNQTSDVYSLGVTFYELLTGVHPFINAPLAEILEVRKDSNITPLKELVPEVPQYLNDVIMQAMRYDYRKRFATAGEMFDSFLAAMDGTAPITPSFDITTDHGNESFDASYDNNSISYDENETDSNKLTTVADQKILDFSNEDYTKSDDFSQKEPNPFATKEAFQAQEEKEDLEQDNNYLSQENTVQYNIPPDDSTVIPSSQNDETIQGIPEETNNELNGTPSIYSDETCAIDNFNDSLLTFQDKQNTGLTLNANTDTDLGLNRPPYDDESNEPQQAQTYDRNSDLIRKRAPKSSDDRKLIVLLFFVLSSIILGVVVAAVLFKKPKDALVDTPKATDVASANVTTLIPKSTTTLLQFPNLPNGTYTGVIKGIFPKMNLPMIVLSDEAHKTLTFLVGIDGWKPITVRLDTTEKKGTDTSITIKGNSYWLIFTPEKNSSDGIGGSFKNKITKEDGTWHIAPLK